MKKFKFDFDDEVTLTNATASEVLRHTASGKTVYTQYNEELFEELKKHMASEYKKAYEKNKANISGYEVAIWKEEKGLKYEW